MKPLLLALLTVGVLAACSSPTAPSKHATAIQKDGEPCVTADGRSGYIVTSGFQTYCQANP